MSTASVISVPTLEEHFEGQLRVMVEEYRLRSEELAGNGCARLHARGHAFEEDVLFIILRNWGGKGGQDGLTPEAYKFYLDYCRPNVTAYANASGMTDDEVKKEFLKVAHRHLLFSRP
ncbi:MAG: hypothetical protein AAB343_03600 [Patescibacteria group bacterium]